MDFKTIDFKRDGAIGIITITRPAKMNAINSILLEELDQLVDEVAENNEVLVVIITGTEKFFCAGADLGEIATLKSPIEAHRFLDVGEVLFSKIEDFEKPIIAAINGLALGGGLEIAMACDVRIAAESAFFGQPEVKVGVMPGGGATKRLPRLIGMGRAKQLLFTGETIDAQEAYRIGLVNKVVPSGALMDESTKIAKKMAQNSPLALKYTKMAVNYGVNMDIQSAITHELRCASMLFSTEDQKEGLNAFTEKRKPVFKGK